MRSKDLMHTFRVMGVWKNVIFFLWIVENKAIRRNVFSLHFFCIAHTSVQSFYLMAAFSSSASCSIAGCALRGVRWLFKWVKMRPCASTK